MEKRPNLDKTISIADFKAFYWLKAELVQFCRTEGLRKTDGKIEVAQRIEHYLITGEKQLVQVKPKRSKKSTFDWNNAPLHPQTKITDNYKNTENVRQFFTQSIGKGFKFNVQFMNWMKSNEGKTLELAIEAWKRIAKAKKSNTAAKTIAPQFEYNRYLRDYLAANPNGNRETGIQLWKIKRSMRGDNVYRPSDLDLLEKTYI